MEKVHKDFFYKNAGFVRGRYNLCRIWVESGYKLGIFVSRFYPDCRQMVLWLKGCTCIFRENANFFRENAKGFLIGRGYICDVLIQEGFAGSG